MANPALDHDDDRRPHSGNYAVLDQVAALEWTKRNIAAFGGDPNDITLMGESAGGMSVNMLLASPLTEGKFSKAIMMSGADGRMGGDATLAAAQEKARAFADAHGATIDPARLRSVPSGEIMDNLNLATLGKPSTTYSGPYVDGITVNEPRAVLATSDLRRLRVMIGATSSDIGGPSGRMIAGARAVWLFRNRLPMEKDETGGGFAGFDLLRRPRFGYGALCIFLYVGAEVSIGSLIVSYLVQGYRSARGRSSCRCDRRKSWLCANASGSVLCDHRWLWPVCPQARRRSYLVYCRRD